MGYEPEQTRGFLRFLYANMHLKEEYGEREREIERGGGGREREKWGREAI